MGCSITRYPQPSLDQFYGALEREFYSGLGLHYVKNPDVSYLAKQGVLMLNAALTTEMNKAGSHLLLWQPFIKFLFEEVLFTEGVPIVFLGREAAKNERFLAPFTWVFKISHPASASYSDSEWDSENTFSKVNKLLIQRNGFSINWLNVPEEDNLPF